MTMKAPSVSINSAAHNFMTVVMILDALDGNSKLKSEVSIIICSELIMLHRNMSSPEKKMLRIKLAPNQANREFYVALLIISIISSSFLS